MRVDQLGLLLWKNYVVRKRQPGITALVFIWPIVIFMILYTVRDNVDPEYNPTCQFPARSMPDDGLLPFVQSFVCSVGNPCDPLDRYEEVPSYKNATLGPLVSGLQPMLENETVLAAVRTLPNSIQLLKSMAQILTRPEIKALFDKGIRLGDLFHDHEQIKSLLRMQMPDARPGLVDELFGSSIKLLYLIETFGSSNIDGVVCSPDSLKKYLIVPNDDDFLEISNFLCNIDSEKIPEILENLSKHLDFTGLLAMVDRAMAKFRDYDFFQDLRRAVETILNLKTMKKYVPQYLRLDQWLPKIITAFQNVTFKEIDLNFINKSIAILDPIFATENDWRVAREGLLRLNRLLALVKGILHERNVEQGESNDLFAVIEDLRGAIRSFTSDSYNYENVTQILDLSFAILLDGAKLTNKLIDRHVDDIHLAAEILDGVRDFFSDNIMNSLSYIVSLTDNIIQMTHHVTIIHEETVYRVHEVARKHRDLVQKILTEIDPEEYRVIVEKFSRLDYVENFVEGIRHASPQEFLCREKITVSKSRKLMVLLCTEPGRAFVSDIYQSFEFKNFQRIISNTLSTVINMAFKQVVRVEKSNLTSVVGSARSFVRYLNEAPLPEPDWTEFQIDEKWINVFEETRPQGRLDLLGIHLSIAKSLGSNSISYLTIRPDLENMDWLAGMVLQDLRANPTEWIEEVRRHEAQLIESFYLTVTDREKALKILEYANFTKSYCTESNAPVLLNFPRGSNETALKHLVCRLSSSVQTNLQLNVTDVQLDEAHYRNRRSFNWTAFNEKTIEIYKYIDQLVHQANPGFDTIDLVRLREDFKISWTKNATVKDDWEISVGLICKLFNLMESPLFDIQSRQEWRNVYAIAWASSVIFDNIERVLDKNDNLSGTRTTVQDMPQTWILIEAILGNLTPLVLDIVDIITMKPIHLISLLDDYKSRERQWPCVLNESLGTVLELRNGSREVVREVERISCSPEDFVREWRDQPILMRVRRIFQHDDTVQLPPFNWTLGYTKFRRVVKKLDALVNRTRDEVSVVRPTLSQFLRGVNQEVESIFDKSTPNLKNETRGVLDYIDIEMDKSVTVYGSDRTASGIWKPTVSFEDRVLIFLKFASHVVHKASKVASDILRDVTHSQNQSGPMKLDFLKLLGFDSTTPVSIFYNQLHQILATVIVGLSDPIVEDKIVRSMDHRSSVTCSDIFDWFSVSKVGLTPVEYRTLKNFTCDLDPENFNAYTDLYMAESMIWRKPVNKYRSYLMTSIGDLHDLGKLVGRIKDQEVVIERPFSKIYLNNLLVRLKKSLRSRGQIASSGKDSRTRQDWTDYRLFVEGVSEALLHISDSLTEADVKDDRVYTWDLVKNGDLRQLVKILEKHPQETIALIASLTTLNVTTRNFIRFDDLRTKMCVQHFDTDYWSTTDRVKFMKEVCSFDPHQLLRSITSQEYYDALIHQRVDLLTPTPLTLSTSRLLDVLTNLTSAWPDLTLRSSIFNSTTLANLSNDTLSLIHKCEQTWAHEYTIQVSRSNWRLYQFDKMMQTPDSFTKTVRLYQILDSLVNLLAGGDVWQKLRTMYESSRVKPALTLVEDLPNLVISAVDTFVTSERLNDFVEKLLLGRLHPCDIDKYLIPPSFMRKKGLMSSVTNFCQKIVLAEKELTFVEILPFNAKYEENRVIQNTSTGDPGSTMARFNESYLLERMEHFQTTMFRATHEGFKEPRVPTWWTSFEEGTYKDFLAQYKKKDLRIVAHTVVKKIATAMRDVLTSTYGTGNCSWCVTFPIEIVNSQLSRHQFYTKLICQINRLNVSEIHDILMRDFYWNKTSSMIRNYKYLATKRTVGEFVSSLETTLNYVADIIVNFQNETYSKRVTDCFYKFVGGPNYSRPGLYISFLLGILDTLEKNIYIVDTAASHSSIRKLTSLAEKHVPIWKPLRDVVKRSSVQEIESFLPNASINVNAVLNDRNNSLCRTRADCQNSTVLYEYLSSKRAGKVFRYDPKLAGYPSLLEVSQRLAKSLDLDSINRGLTMWRLDAGFEITWLREIVQHMARVIGESGNLLDVASKIDFQDVSNVLGVPDIADGVVNILKDKTVDKLFAGIKEILEDVEPFVKDQQIMDDLNAMVGALESMEIFKNLGLLDMKYVVRDMFDDWDFVRRYLVDKIGVSNDVASSLSQSKIDMVSVFMKERRAISLKDTICSPKKLGDMLNLDNVKVTAEEVSAALCQLNDSQTQNVTITLMKNLNFDYIFKNLMSANVKSILANANLTEAEGRTVLENLGVAAELLPFFRDRLSSGVSSDRFQDSQGSDGPISTSMFLEDSNELLCGRRLVSDNSQLYRLISQIEDNSKYDQRELDSLPSEFCRETYKSVLNMSAGKIIWSYVKPLLRGQILYSPNRTSIDQLMSMANRTFLQLDNFGTLLDSFEKTLSALANLTEMGDSLRELQGIMASDVMKIAIKSFGGGNFEGDFSDLNLSEVAWRLKRSPRLIRMVSMLNDLLGCVLLDRVHGFSTEEEMEAEARRLMETRDFLAGVVFLDDSPRSKRSMDDPLSEDITYKIRMDVDYVPSTRRLKNQFWIPGPESSFIEHLRYLRGFVQLQDSIDRAVIRMRTGREQSWRTVTQQMPYPCWKYTPFQTTLYESQGVQVCFFFALMMCVGASVRHIVWERESRNSMVMSVMGLKPWRNTLAWFITSFVELLIVMLCISLILLAGKILPRSDPLLIFIMLVDYVFSIVTFCYMISTIFSSASLAAVTTVVMLLLTYMPYIIVIAMEAVLGLGYKLLICLSMSTSFCYGCLFAVRKEVQGTGLQWSDMWDEPSPGDPMSLGLILLMILVDGCLYASIGYLVARYTNSGRGLHGLRSRSLWWTETRSLYGRPSYLGFVNNLYFTNDALHSEATTCQDDESDVSSLTVSEKQIGVRFESVRKVYETDQGDVVAVDDFTLKLSAGEVTSLLGRNGAGKTTIIKMLTGMLAPTSGEICLNGEEGCKPDIGVCPQDNVLIGTLTPREHMIFYSRLKRPKGGLDIERNVNEMLSSLELGRQEHEPVHRLSGGTRRRLCVALAFLGSPSLVILDEPGAGVDPAARRRIWRLIDQHRHGRTVILSTHHLDEADMLSDTVVVMNRGKILCTGSPLSLKMTHGRGYRLQVSYPQESVERERLENLRKVIEEAVPNAIMTDASQTSEVVVNLPFQGKHGINNDIAQAAKALEENRKLLGYSHFSLECDTLERVFLDLCARADTGSSSVIRASQDSVASVDHVGLTIPNDDVDLINVEPVLRPSPFRQAKALLKKRVWHFAKDWRAPLAALALPTMFVAVAMGFSLIRPPSENEPPLRLTPKLYDTHPTYFYSIDEKNDPFLQHVSLQLHDRFGDDYAGAWQALPNDTGTCECLDGQQTCQGTSQPVEGLLQVLPGRPALDWIVSTHQVYIERRYGGWSLSHAKDEPLFIVWFNNKGHHALPSYLNALNEAILRATGSRGRLTALNHPLKLSRDQLNRTSLLQHVADVGVALVLLIAFSLVGAQGTKELVRERLSEEKRILYLAGVHPVTYWISALIWDFFVFACSIGLAVIVFEIFGLPAYVARDNLAGVCLLLVLFSWAAIPFSHLAEKAFDDPSLSNMVLFCVNTFIGVTSLATILVLDILGKTETARETRRILHNVLMILPQYALGDALVQISRNDITAQLLEQFDMDTYQSPLGWDLLGRHFVFLTVVGGLLFLLNLLIECRFLPSFSMQRPGCAYEAVQDDDDVARERMRIEGRMADDTLQTVKLRKEYRSVYGTNVAVQNLSLGVQAGQCFGLLGTNGAGKSTTFKMLTTEVTPTAGRIVLKGQEIGSGPLCNGEVGYCSQCDALDGFLTPYQCLTVHGEVSGLINVPRAVEAMLKRFDLTRYAHRRVDSLSGGNKRKLCTAISVMAPVSVVLMDEPTSGMDPGTKDLVAQAIRHVTKSQGCVILTSHSVAECENLCNRVGILARAGLRCIGTPQHLKHKFGEGYVAFLRFGQPVPGADLRRAISRHLPQAVVSSRQASAARLLVPRSQDVPLSTSFAKVKLLAEDLKATDYTLTQSSLDQVLVNFSEELDDDSIDTATFQGSRHSHPNMYSSMDTIHMETF